MENVTILASDLVQDSIRAINKLYPNYEVVKITERDYVDSIDKCGHPGAFDWQWYFHLTAKTEDVGLSRISVASQPIFEIVLQNFPDAIDMIVSKCDIEIDSRCEFPNAEIWLTAVFGENSKAVKEDPTEEDSLQTTTEPKTAS